MARSPGRAQRPSSRLSEEKSEQSPDSTGEWKLSAIEIEKVAARKVQTSSDSISIRL